MPRRKKEKPEIIMVIGPNQAGFIKSYVNRLESLNEDAKAISDDKKELKKEAEQNGIDWNTIKLAVARRKKGELAVEREDELLEMYEGALQGKLFPEGETESRNPNPRAKLKAEKVTPPATVEPTPIEKAAAAQAEGDDVEIPSFLRRLAGAGDEPQGETDPESAASPG